MGAAQQPCNTIEISSPLAHSPCTLTSPNHQLNHHHSSFDLCQATANGSRTAAPHPHIKPFPLARLPCTLTFTHSPPPNPQPPKPSPFPLVFVQGSSQWELHSSPPSPYEALPPMHAHLAHSSCTLTPPNPPQLTLPHWLSATTHREQSSSQSELHSSPPSHIKLFPPLHAHLAHSHPQPPPPATFPY